MRGSPRFSLLRREFRPAASCPPGAAHGQYTGVIVRLTASAVTHAVVPRGCVVACLVVLTTIA